MIFDNRPKKKLLKKSRIEKCVNIQQKPVRIHYLIYNEYHEDLMVRPIFVYYLDPNEE
jgi:hypothetical protein